MAHTQQGHVRKRKDGLWEGQYVFQKQKRSIYGETEIEARKMLEEIIHSINIGEYIRPNEHTVSSWLNECLDTYAKSSLRPSTFVSYELYIKKHISPALGNVLLKNVSVRALQSFFNKKLIGGRCDKKKGGLSPKTLKNIKYMLDVAFSQAYYNRIIPFNPIEGVRLPVPAGPEQKVLDSSEKDMLFQAAQFHHTTIAKGLVILLNCGLRKGELLGLQWENINFDENYMRVKDTLARLPHFEITSATQGFIRIDTYQSKRIKTGIYLGPVKKKANRIIYLPESVRRALIELREIQISYRNKFIGGDFNPFGFVLCTENGLPIDPKTFEEKFRGFVHESKVKDINIHATRHTFATEALNKSSDLITISEILGHAKPSTTLDMYGHTFDSRKRSLMALFD